MRVRERLLQVVCVVRMVGGPLYSLERSVPAISLYGKMPNRLQDGTRGVGGGGVQPNQGFGRPHLAATGHHPSPGDCLVGPDVR